VCLRPHPHLSAYISSYNITFPTKHIMPDGFTAMPCGCATLVIENNGKDLFVALDGPTTKPHIVGSQANQLKMLVTIEFRPAGLYALTGISQSELADETIALDAVRPELSKSLRDAVERAESVCPLATSLDALLLENMVAAYHPQFMAALERMVGCAGNIGVKKLSSDVHYSERQLNRIFKQHAGVSAKSFSRFIRIHNAFRLIQKPHHSLTLVSDVMGFHDLSHFVRDFRSVCGITPQAYRNNMSGFYINPKKY
ncbi:MAG: helix-turn-helix domain-containing protein, partial [Betaproteobacteria bacterium]|nr:helix-turn-helix domain-containing protein [Betaproteobacteria bacterium]